MEEDKTIRDIKRERDSIRKDVEIQIDDISGQKFEINWKDRDITNITYASEKVVGIRRFTSHPYRYKLRGQIRTMTDKTLLIFEVEDKKTGQRRITIKDEVTNIRYPISAPNVVDLMRIFADFISDKEKTNIPDEYNWLVPVFNERYAGELIGMILESKDYGVTAKEVMERFKFTDIQKARNVLYKFKKAKFLTGQKTNTREMFYTPTIDRTELVNFIKTIFRTEEKDIFDLR